MGRYCRRALYDKSSKVINNVIVGDQLRLVDTATTHRL